VPHETQASHHHGQVGGEITVGRLLGILHRVPTGRGRGPEALFHPLVKTPVKPLLQSFSDHDAKFLS